jgi:hypothetical protein
MKLRYPAKSNIDGYGQYPLRFTGGGYKIRQDETRGRLSMGKTVLDFLRKYMATNERRARLRALILSFCDVIFGGYL